MIIGSIMLIFIHFTFSIPDAGQLAGRSDTDPAAGYRILAGPFRHVAFRSENHPGKQIGDSLALIFWVQNWGLMGVPYMIGIVLDQYCISGEINGKPTYDYTIPMLIFTCFGVLALVISLLLKREDRIKGYGLELPNIKKDADIVLAEEMIGEGQR